MMCGPDPEAMKKEAIEVKVEDRRSPRLRLLAWAFGRTPLLAKPLRSAPCSYRHIRGLLAWKETNTEAKVVAAAARGAVLRRGGTQVRPTVAPGTTACDPGRAPMLDPRGW